MNGLIVTAAADPHKSLSGGFGLLVVFALAVVVVFLFRSMNRHLRKVRQINFDDDKPPAGSAPSRDSSPKPPVK